MAKSTSKKTTQETAVAAHSQYILDRNKKIDLMAKKLGADTSLRKQFDSDPQKVAGQFNLVLSDEEAFAAKALRSVPLENLANRLKRQNIGFWDNNCQCSGG